MARHCSYPQATVDLNRIPMKDERLMPMETRAKLVQARRHVLLQRKDRRGQGLYRRRHALPLKSGNCRAKSELEGSLRHRPWLSAWTGLIRPPAGLRPHDYVWLLVSFDQDQPHPQSPGGQPSMPAPDSLLPGRANTRWRQSRRGVLSNISHEAPLCPPPADLVTACFHNIHIGAES